MKSFKKICLRLKACLGLFVFFIILGLHNPIPVYSQTDNEPNDDYSTASPLVLNGRNTGHLDYSLDRVDWWSFTIDKDGELTKIAAIFDTSLRFYLWIYDTDGATVLYGDLDSGSSPHVFGPFGLKAGTYYVKLQARNSGYSGQYTLDTYYADQPRDNDAEPNVNALEAKPMNANGVTTGHLGYRGGDPVIDKEDWWSITSDIAREITFSAIFDTSLRFYLWIYDTDGATLLYGDIDSGSSGQKVFGTFSFIAGKKYYVKLLTRNDNYYGGYRFDTSDGDTTTTINPTTTSTTSIISTTTTTTASTTTINPIPASCGTVTPSTGLPGDVKDLIIKGNNTHFSGSTEVDFSCTGISLASLTQNSATEIKVTILIANDAPADKCDITVQTGSETINCTDAFEIITGPSTTTTIPEQITADFIGSPSSGSAPLSVNFTNMSSGGITTYEWKFGDGSASAEKDPVHVYKKRGTYSVILTVTGANSNTATKTRENYISVTSKCPIVNSIDSKRQIDILRAARDANLDELSVILATSVYYQDAAEINALLNEKPVLKTRLKEVVNKNIEVVAALVQGRPANLSAEALNEITDYLEELKVSGSIKLQYDIDFVLLSVRSGLLLPGLGITIE